MIAPDILRFIKWGKMRKKSGVRLWVVCAIPSSHLLVLLRRNQLIKPHKTFSGLLRGKPPIGGHDLNIQNVLANLSPLVLQIHHFSADNFPFFL